MFLIRRLHITDHFVNIVHFAQCAAKSLSLAFHESQCQQGVVSDASYYTIEMDTIFGPHISRSVLCAGFLIY